MPEPFGVPDMQLVLVLQPEVVVENMPRSALPPVDCPIQPAHRYGCSCRWESGSLYSGSSAVASTRCVTPLVIAQAMMQSRASVVILLPCHPHDIGRGSHTRELFDWHRGSAVLIHKSWRVLFGEYHDSVLGVDRYIITGAGRSQGSVRVVRIDIRLGVDVTVRVSMGDADTLPILLVRRQPVPVEILLETKCVFATGHIAFWIFTEGLDCVAPALELCDVLFMRKDSGRCTHH
jgi:hypothetical protein